MTEEPSKAMMIRLPEGLYAALVTAAQLRQYATPSEAAREAIRQWIERTQPA